ncbi:MAG: CPBP family intramembrane metalloprotease [Bacteroidia bacterium]|nr:CPBP family intramembrane metalloprotease [Bacteroidia bacterium]
MKKYALLIFFILSLLISWAGWIPYAASKAGLLNLNIPSEIIWLAEFGPTISAIVITLLIFDKADKKSLLKRLLIWKTGIKWYFFAILVTPILIMASIGIDILFFKTTYDFSLLSQWDINFINRTEAFTPSMGIITQLVSFMHTGTFATGLVFLVLALTNGGLSEEIGWRGFALSKLQGKPYNFLVSSLIVAFLWAFWHTGTLFWQTVFTSTFSEGISFAATYLFQYLLLVIPLSVLYTVLYNGTNGSILLSIILHAFYNISISIFATALSNFPMIIFVVLLWIVAILLTIILWKKSKYNKIYTNETNKASS